MTASISGTQGSHEQARTRTAGRSADQSKVGLEIPHESADLHVTGQRAVHRGPDRPDQGRPARLAGAGAARACALITGLRVKPAYDVPGVVQVLTAEDVPGVNDAGISTTSRCSPSEVMFYGHAVCWVLGETLDAARPGAEAIEVDYEPLPSLMTLTEAIAAESFQGHQRTVSRGDADAGLASAAHRFTGEFEFGGQEHFYLETHAALALVDENGQIFVQSRPSTRRRPRRSSPTSSGLDAHASPCSACGWAAASAARRCSRTASPRSRRWAPP